MTSSSSIPPSIGLDMSLQGSSMSISTAANSPTFSNNIEQILQQPQEQKHQGGSNENERQDFKNYNEDNKNVHDSSFNNMAHVSNNREEYANDENNNNTSKLSTKSKSDFDKFDKDISGERESDSKFILYRDQDSLQKEMKNNLKFKNDEIIVNDLLKKGDELLRELEKSSEEINYLSIENAILMDDLMMADYGNL